ncbi:MAG: KpsF/GutQ family sugar-phosphate isomerase [Deltaproteobacteria bacterium]|nr:KpsF/GutQ family sugar-phosphate isomerase [Deltaproteobacteria bacterium]
MSIKTARRVLSIESEAVSAMRDRIGASFAKAVEMIYGCKAKVIVTGMGKSGLICQKIASTFASTGTPAFFLHPAEGVHGDLGAMTANDVVIAVSKSGDTEEVLRMLPVIRRMGVPLIAMTGRHGSMLGRAAEVVLDVSVKEEACVLDLAPTASTTATLAMGDALAVALMERRGFKDEDFALFHPSGALGRKLLLRVEDLMHAGKQLPAVGPDVTMKEAVLEISSKRLGVTCVLDGRGNLAGIITDGDLRRGIGRYPNLFERKVRDIMTRKPRRTTSDALAAHALAIMEEHAITSLVVFPPNGARSKKPVGIIHIHDILKAGVA